MWLTRCVSVVPPTRANCRAQVLTWVGCCDVLSNVDRGRADLMTASDIPIERDLQKEQP